MIVYLDTSTLLRVLLGQRPTLAGWGSWERAYTSELAGVEARLVIDRLRLTALSTMTASRWHKSSWRIWRQGSAVSISPALCCDERPCRWRLQ